MLQPNLRYFEGRAHLTFGCALYDYAPDDPRAWWAVVWALVVEAFEGGMLRRMIRLDEEFRWGGLKVHLAETFGRNADNDAALAAYEALIPAEPRTD